MRGLGFQVSPDELARIIRRHEQDGKHDSPLISRKNFLGVMADRYRTRDPKDEMRRAFQLFDRDHTGRVT